jgi:lysophospholipase L1-like esterase
MATEIDILQLPTADVIQAAETTAVTAAADAEAARVAAVAAKTAAEAVPTTTDGIMAAVLDDPDSEFGTSLNATIEASVETSTGDAKNGQAFRAQIAKRDNARTTVLVAGDSFAEITGAATAEVSSGRRMLSALRSRFPVSAAPGGIGYQPAYTGRLASPTANFAVTAGDAPTPIRGFGFGEKSVRVPAGTSISVTFTGTAIDVRSGIETGAATITPTMDATTLTAFTIDGAANSDGYVWSTSGLTAGSHTLVLTNTGSTDWIFEGYQPFNGTESAGIELVRAGHGSFTTTDFVSTLGARFNALYSSVDIHAAVVIIGTNDPLYDVPAATTKANLLAWFAALDATQDVAPTKVLVAQPLRADAPAVTAEIWSPYVAAIRDVAAALGAVFVNMGATITGVPGSADATGLLSTDKVHLNSNGHRMLGELIAEHIWRGVGVGPALSVGSPGRLLGATVYRPASQRVLTTSSTAMVPADSVTPEKLTVSFTALTSRVLVRLTAECAVTAGQGAFWGLRYADPAANVANSRVSAVGSGVAGYPVVSRDIYLSGLTPGNRYQFVWAMMVSNAAGTATLIAGGNSGPAVMQVFDADDLVVVTT